MIMDHAYIILDTSGEDDIPTPMVFTIARKAAERLVSWIDGQGMSDAEGEDLDMDAVLAWTGDEDLEVWDSEGRVVFTLSQVEVDPE